MHVITRLLQVIAHSYGQLTDKIIEAPGGAKRALISSIKEKITDYGDKNGKVGRFFTGALVSGLSPITALFSLANAVKSTALK